MVWWSWRRMRTCRKGTEVEVIPRTIPQAANAFVEGMLKLAKPRDWPEDFALNHRHFA